MKTPFSLADDAAYRAAMIKLDALQEQLASREKEFNQHQMQHYMGIRMNQSAIQAVSDAEKILAGEQLERKPDPTETIDRLRREIEALKVAIEMQKRTVTVEIDRVLREEAPELQKRYRGLLEGMAKALLAAAQACQAEEDFCSEIDLAASSRFSATGIVRQPFRILGNPAQEWSAVSLWLTEVKRAGYLR